MRRAAVKWWRMRVARLSCIQVVRALRKPQGKHLLDRSTLPCSMWTSSWYAAALRVFPQTESEMARPRKHVDIVEVLRPAGRIELARDLLQDGPRVGNSLIEPTEQPSLRWKRSKTAARATW
jgi:hypothetical protein